MEPLQMPMIPKELNHFLDARNRQLNKNLKAEFRNHIKGNFMLSILNEVRDALGNSVGDIYPEIGSFEAFVSNYYFVDRDLCAHIVGIHSSNIIFKKPEEIHQLEADRRYRQKLVRQVVRHVRLREIGSRYFRPDINPEAESFMYYSVGFDLYAMIRRCTAVLPGYEQDRLSPMIMEMLQQAYSVLLLLEGYCMQYAYSLCRPLMEQFFRFLLLTLHPEALSRYIDFRKYEIYKNCYDGSEEQYPESFLSLHRQKTDVPIIDFLHYGWLDAIPDSSHTGKKRYSMSEIMAQLRHTKYADLVKCLAPYYRKCHGYIHSNMTASKYPLLDYFELSIILSTVILTLADYLQKSGVSLCVKNVELKDMLEEDTALLREQYAMRSEENFRLRYNR